MTFVAMEGAIMLANYHTHTVRCGHAAGREEEYIEHAISQGFKILGFSDHVPQPFPDGYVSGIRMTMDELPEYIKTLMALKDKYRNDIEILIGFEVEYTVKYFDRLMDILGEYPVDYIIQGQHNVPDEIEGFYAGSRTDDEGRLREYVNFTIEGMKTGVFAYLAHPDLINYTGSRETFLKHMSKIAEASVELNLPLEVNMYGFHDRRNYPRSDFFRMAVDMGAPIVIGCDAHIPWLVRQPENLEGFAEFLKQCDITPGDNIVSFD